MLRFLQGFSVAETAQAMGKNEGAIKALQYRAVRALHRLLPDGLPAVSRRSLHRDPGSARPVNRRVSRVRHRAPSAAR